MADDGKKTAEELAELLVGPVHEHPEVTDEQQKRLFGLCHQLQGIAHDYIKGSDNALEAMMELHDAFAAAHAAMDSSLGALGQMMSVGGSEHQGPVL